MMRRGGIFVPELNYGSAGEGISDDAQVRRERSRLCFNT